MVVSFIGGGNPRKPVTCHKSLTNFITIICVNIGIKKEIICKYMNKERYRYNIGLLHKYW
jgi:hypothetical protein